VEKGLSSGDAASATTTKHNLATSHRPCHRSGMQPPALLSGQFIPLSIVLFTRIKILGGFLRHLCLRRRLPAVLGDTVSHDSCKNDYADDPKPYRGMSETSLGFGTAADHVKRVVDDG
jgi:hypothetical protein